jgi:hypothetical protein
VLFWIGFVVDDYVLELIVHFPSFPAFETEKLLSFLSVSFDLVFDDHLFDSLRAHGIVERGRGFANQERVRTYACNHNCFGVSTQRVFQHPCQFAIAVRNVSDNVLPRVFSQRVDAVSQRQQTPIDVRSLLQFFTAVQCLQFLRTRQVNDVQL